MSILVSQKIAASADEVWRLITDIDGCVERISGIQKVTILDRPQQGIVGLKWEETRLMFGKEAIETMWVSSAEEPHWYQTTAHNHGAIYTSRMEVSETEGGCTLSMSFSTEATTIGARIMSKMSFLFNGALKKMMAQDLLDIKQAAESG